MRLSSRGRALGYAADSAPTESAAMPGNAKQVLILGFGAMGQAFEAMLSPRHDVLVWDRDLQTQQETQPLETAAPGRDVVVFALPTDPHEELAGRLASCLDEGAVCFSIAKGLDARGRSPAQIFEHHFGTRLGWALMCGPMLARELRAGLAGFAMVASRRPEAIATVRSLFVDTGLRLEGLDDVHGAAWASILKNVYVPLVGAADGLELGDNLRGFLIAEATNELGRIVEHLGGRRETAWTCAGLADLVASATGASSHHRRLGADLACGRMPAHAAFGPNIRSEGLHTVAMVRAHDVLDWRRFELFALVCRFLDEPECLQQALADYLRRRFA
jgi:glycerol-3-phosphate dehydrogenase (NAD(P)+)